ncbi:endonuclease/exonuclease/phosphatase family protein [Gemella haemolysans]|uniref:LPXTG-motif cell wall anchor domain protein n=2 Tax=Gemella haemolysans TaxID=1379 RepID=C5NV97_9BACL|nr:endonuclease/exonuclease/phosphatase family protein [Gemella haemolysans]EER68892.1 LPXTG-motif cell wall anchor domain protein [Gemella haemolysans ATCC 10379]KAA8707004.1 LPXTG cell wall anchor domain-containing protein [Gemella haemolysans]UBH81869.1 LPXTG cell wall anchor domain-containing protein [Gemella haemolysans]
MKKYKLSILLASAVLGGVGATYLSAEVNEVSAAEVKTEVVTPATTTDKNEGTPAGATASAAQVTAPKEVKNIGEVQGESHESPLAGKEVIINNVVVTKTDKTGFYVQDKVSDNNPRTSDAVYVASKDKVASGDLLKVQGTVKEGYMEEYSVKPGQTFKKPAGSLTVTQIINATITKLGKAELPKALNISEKMPKDIVDQTPTKYNPETEALDYWESLEGMRVEVTKPKVTGPQYKGDIYVLPGDYKGQKLNNIGGVNLRPGVQNTEVLPVTVGNKFVAKAKDYFNENISGVVTYRNKTYKIDPSTVPTLQDGGLKREVSKIYPAEDKLTIASYNIENFSANNNGHDETPEEKVDKIANSFIKEVHSPDIITLIEVQDNNGGVNDGTVDGVKSGEKLAQRIKSLGGPDYKYTEIAPVDGKDGGKPGANIRVAYLYNPKRVTLIGKEKGGSEEAARFVNGHLEKNPARIDPTSVHFEKVRKSLAAEFEFKGERIVVIANHLKSKLGDDAIYGSNQPSVENTKAKRIEEAKILNAFIKEGLRQNPNLKFVLTGDFNDFEFSDSVKTIVGNELVNLMAEHEQGDRYSYFYRGSNQSLDNVLISKNIKDKVVFSPVHINASFMEEHGRASDHDPVVVQIDFSKSAAPESPGLNPINPANPDSLKDSTNSATSEQTEKDVVRTVRLADGVTVSVKYNESKINNIDKFVAQDITGERAKEIKELVKEFNSELNVVRTLELHFEDKDGKELKATGENRVVTLAVVKDENQQLKVYHVNGNVLEEIKNTSYEDGKLTFNTNHFSTFVITAQSLVLGNNTAQADATNTVPKEAPRAKEDKKAKILPNTGINSSSTEVAGLGLIALVGLAVRRKLSK